LSGGLGPTVDDFTIDVIANALDRKTIFREDLWNILRDKLIARNRTPNEGTKKQFNIIEGAEALDNPVGQAPGEYINYQDKHIFLLPGVPTEFHSLFDIVIKTIEKKSAAAIPYRTMVFKFADIPESDLDKRIKNNLKDFLPLPEEDFIITTKPGVQTVSLISRLSSEAFEKRKSELNIILLKEFPANLFASESLLLEEIVANLLKNKNLKIATAESCTGGLLADRLTNIPGSSEYFIEGIVSYHNSAKINLLNVKEETLDKYGAVSEETAREMAIGLYKKSGVDITVSVTGIAGPSGGTVEKPVGTVFIAIVDKNGCNVEKRNLSGTRRFFKEWVSSVALNLVRLHIQRYY
jgi:nicotinamide-nucleotide amidase